MNGVTRPVLLGSVIVMSLAIVVSFVTSAVVASRAYVQRGAQPFDLKKSLTVTGSAKHRIVADLAIWKLWVKGEGKTMEEAFAKIEASEQGVRSFFKKHAIADSQVLAGAISTDVHRKKDEKGNELREVVSYELTRTFTVTAEEVRKVERVAGEVTELLKGGLRVLCDPPQYIVTNLGELKMKVIGEATANARARAELIATNSKCRVGEVREARAGVLQITPPWSTEVSAGGQNDTSTIDKDITSVMSLDVAIRAE
ncbi:MAG TPA: SIMPL domain-containing protein [Planctomycetota bacterium]|nr:SIMPL domain-containing protein [Planctomycetota bacterium]